MRAAQLVGYKRFEFVDVDTPTPAEGECLIKMEKVSICGGDIHGNGYHLLPEELYPLPVGRPNHECAGVVVESRCDEYREGQRVIVLPGGGKGGLVEYITSAPERMIALPDHGDLTEWVMCQPSGTVLASCQKMGNVLGKNVVILGQGSIGQSFTMILSRQGAREVIAVDPLDYRLEMSRMSGASYAINPSTEKLEEVVQEITRGEGADIVVEAAGSPQAFNDCFRLVRKYGTIIMFASQDSPHSVMLEDQMLILRQQPTLIGTAGGGSGIPDMVSLRERGWMDPGVLVTHRWSFNDVQKAYDMYDQHTDNVIKVVMSM